MSYLVENGVDTLRSNMKAVCYLPDDVTAEPSIKRLRLLRNQSIELSWSVPEKAAAYNYYYRVEVYDSSVRCTDVQNASEKALETKDIHGQNATYLYYDGRNQTGSLHSSFIHYN